MHRKSKLVMIGSLAVILIIIIAFAGVVISKLTPSKEVMQLTEYYEVSDSEVLLILQDEIYEKKGILLNDKVYLDFDTVVEYFNHRFYWDSNENILTYTTPDEIIQAEAGDTGYKVTKSMIETEMRADNPLVEVDADKVYLSLDFVRQHSDMSYEYYENPRRVVIQYLWGDYLYTEVTKKTQLRSEASIKSPVLRELEEGTSLMLVDTEEVPAKGFTKVMTEDGVRGYVKNKHVGESSYQTISSTYQAPVYTAQIRTEPINMVFHQVFNQDAASKLEGLIKATKDVNVIAPTWFSVKDDSGNISSLATKEYVEKANDLGLEVWALADDFNTEISMYEVLSHTSTRKNLTNSLIEAALAYKLNGINIDFEKISSEAGVHFIQFLRELSVKCRNNGIVLSVDNYVPTAYTAYYDREEQGKIVDYVITMAYDEYYAGSEVAGPVASLGYVKDAVNNILTEVPKEKVIIAIPFYTRLWKETANGEVSAESFSMTPAANWIKDNNIETVWDDTYGCYYAELKKDGVVYRMWQEEDRSIEEKMKVIYEADVAGIAAWKLGLETESIWNVITPYLN